MIDTHAHIYLKDFEEDLDLVIGRAQQQGIEQILMPNIDSTTIESMLKVENQYPEMCKSMIGLHPCSVKKDFERELYTVEEWINKQQFVAIGEIGTDLYWDKTLFEEQKEAFKIQCQLALTHHLPVAIHCRESIDETIELVTPFAEQGLRGVFHCFTGSTEQAERVAHLGFLLGIGGVLTFKNSVLDSVIEKVHQRHLLLETDSPYLAPAPFRGKRNEPVYLRQIVEKLTAVQGSSFRDVVEETTKNARELFKLNVTA